MIELDPEVQIEFKIWILPHFDMSAFQLPLGEISPVSDLVPNVMIAAWSIASGVVIQYRPVSQQVFP